ncbi:MAG: hypothetical protein ABFC62_04590 [Clostridiaceae bacterium]|nr:hypothetical protein [Eubacteriales bacterium]
MKKRVFCAALLTALTAAALFTACADGGTVKDTTPPAVQTPPSLPPRVAPTRPPATAEQADPNEAALAAYGAVLRNETEFYGTDNEKALFLQDFLTNGELYGTMFDLARAAFLDMDGDGVIEAVLELTVNGCPEFYEVLHCINDAVYGYNVVYRGLELLKTDGTFLYSNGAADYGYGRLAFGESGYDMAVLAHTELDADREESVWFIGDESVSEDAFASFEQKQAEKEDVSWQEVA